MHRRSTALFVLALTALLSCAGELGIDDVSASAPRGEAPRAAAVHEPTELVGQLLLPGDGGRRGVELHAWFTGPGDEPNQLWIFPEDDGRFSRDISGTPTRLSVHAGSEVHRIDAEDLPRADANGRIDLGAIDLRERLVVRRVRLRATDGAAESVVRVGLWIDSPNRGPRGELPSLGSKQFPPVLLDSEMEWLLPPDAGAVHFLVESPDGPGRGTNWRSGEQWEFGPYESSAFPLELLLD